MNVLRSRDLSYTLLMPNYLIGCHPFVDKSYFDIHGSDGEEESNYTNTTSENSQKRVSEARKQASVVYVGALVIKSDGAEAGRGVQSTARREKKAQNDTVTAIDRPASFRTTNNPNLGP